MQISAPKVELKTRGQKTGKFNTSHSTGKEKDMQLPFYNAIKMEEPGVLI